jgi:UDP:flavonoid glycosyltransferase YjiC (YdhE family)
MSTFLAYTSPSAGHLFPVVPGLQELRRRGHDVHVVTAPHLVEVARAAGLQAVGVDERILQVHVADHEIASDRARLRLGLAQIMDRGPFEIDDLRAHIGRVRPDALLIDTNAYGAAVAAEASGLRWATTFPSLLPLPGPGIPAYGLGMKPGSGPLTTVRDRLLWRLVARAYGKAMLPPLNGLRDRVGLAPLRSPFEHVLGPTRLLVLTDVPLEYERSSLPASVRMVGFQTWDPPATAPAWLDEPGDPWVLVTCSTEYQADEVLARTAMEALADEPVRVVVTMADAYDGLQATPPANARVVRFAPHGPILDRAAAVVCPGGMGITAKAVAKGVPLVVVPFGRDQPEVARRVVEARAGVSLRKRDLGATGLRDAVRQAMALRGAVAPTPPGDPATRFADAAMELTDRAVVASR